jgi:hypothetical protein
MAAEEVDYPVVGIGWHVKLSQLLVKKSTYSRNFGIVTLTADQRTLSTWHLRVLTKRMYGAGGGL